MSGSPVGGQIVSFSPVRWSYQLKYWPLGVVALHPLERASVRVEPRRPASRWPMMPSRSATSALHMYAPMFVVEVCTLRVPSALERVRRQAGPSSVIATNDAHVPARSGAARSPPSPVPPATAQGFPPARRSATS